VTALVLAGVGWLGWSIALAAVLTLLRRRALEADAAHELRGAATAIGLAVERMERGAAPGELGPLLRLQLARLRGGLGELEGSALDVERLAQVIANVAANAAEHGVGPVDVKARRDGDVVRVEVRNAERGGRSTAAPGAGRGRGIAIAQRAAGSLGGRVRVESEGGVTRAVVELPTERLPAGPPAERAAPERLPAPREPRSPGGDFPRAA
jgi:signal transduction histidine kinase